MRSVGIGLWLTALSFTTAPAAWGHATFAGVKTAPANSDVELSMRVPEERGEEFGNVKIVVTLPADVVARNCVAAAPWQCQSAAAVGSTPGRIEWTRDTSAARPIDADETFVFTIRTGAAGKKPFPVAQHYSDGDTEHWEKATGTQNPAPNFTVEAGATTTTGPTATTATSSTTGMATATTTAGSSTTTATTAAAGGGAGTQAPTTTSTTTWSVAAVPTTSQGASSSSGGPTLAANGALASTGGTRRPWVGLASVGPSSPSVGRSSRGVHSPHVTRASVRASLL